MAPGPGPRGVDRRRRAAARHFVAPSRLKDLPPRLLQCRSQVAAEREMRNAPPELPAARRRLHRPAAETCSTASAASTTPANWASASPWPTGSRGRRPRRLPRRRRLVLGGPRPVHGPQSSHHNELPPEPAWACRASISTATDRQRRPAGAARPAADHLRRSGAARGTLGRRHHSAVPARALEPALALRVFRREATEYYGLRSPWLTQLFAAVTGPATQLRELFRALGSRRRRHPDHPRKRRRSLRVVHAGRAAAGGLMGPRRSRLLLGRGGHDQALPGRAVRAQSGPAVRRTQLSAMPRNTASRSAFCRSGREKLEGLGRWYEHLVSESLGKQGRGPTPLTVVQTRDLHSRGQQHQEGPRDRVINNLVVKGPHSAPHRRPDGRPQRGRPQRLQSQDAAGPAAGHPARRSTRPIFEAARPTADLVLPALSEHTLGQLLQMLMLATVVEGRLMGINPYSAPSADGYSRCHEPGSAQPSRGDDLEPGRPVNAHEALPALILCHPTSRRNHV